MVYQTGDNQYQISKYIVDATSGDSPYNTIQSALDAANAAGGNASVIIRNGTYTENLTLYSGVDLVGDSEQATVIIGTHTPPSSGVLNIFRCAFQSATDIFNSAIAGTTDIIIEDCAVTVTNGYTFNLLNWTGSVAIFDIGNGGTNDGFFNNTAGASFFAFSTGFGNGTGNTMNVSGFTLITTADCLCPINFQSTAIVDITTSSFGQTLTTSNTATVSIKNSSLSTGANQSITHNSSNAITLSDVNINTSNATAIGGTGSVIFGSVTYEDSSTIAGTITQTYGTTFQTGNIISGGIVSQVPTSTQNIVAGTGITAAMFAGIVRVQGSGGAVTVTATPSIADGVDGQTMIIQGDSDANTVTLQDEGTLANSGLSLSGATNFTLGEGHILRLTFDAGLDKWLEVSRSAN